MRIESRVIPFPLRISKSDPRSRLAAMSTHHDRPIGLLDKKTIAWGRKKRPPWSVATRGRARSAGHVARSQIRPSNGRPLSSENVFIKHRRVGAHPQQREGWFGCGLRTRWGWALCKVQKGDEDLVPDRSASPEDLTVATDPDGIPCNVELARRERALSRRPIAGFSKGGLRSCVREVKMVVAGRFWSGNGDRQNPRSAMVGRGSSRADNVLVATSKAIRRFRSASVGRRRPCRRAERPRGTRSRERCSSL